MIQSLLQAKLEPTETAPPPAITEASVAEESSVVEVELPTPAVVAAVQEEDKEQEERLQPEPERRSPNRITLG